MNPPRDGAQPLEGQTPAERAGVGVEGADKWLALLRNAVEREAKNSS